MLTTVVLQARVAYTSVSLFQTLFLSFLPNGAEFRGKIQERSRLG